MGPQQTLKPKAEASQPNPAGVISRRTFVEVGVAGLLIGFDLFGAVEAHAQSAANDIFAPNAYIRIGRDGRLTLVMQQIEMGEGTYTAQAMLKPKSWKWTSLRSPSRRRRPTTGSLPTSCSGSRSRAARAPYAPRGNLCVAPGRRRGSCW
jgi:hypothetical protein